MNKVILIGRLTADPEKRYTQTGVAVTNFRLAVDRPFTNQQGQREADFFPVVTWRGLAETCAAHLNKGRLVAVEGRLQVRSYQAQDGSTRWVTEVIADNVQFLDYPRENGQAQQQPQAPAQQQAPQGAPQFQAPPVQASTVNGMLPPHSDADAPPEPALSYAGAEQM